MTIKDRIKKLANERGVSLPVLESKLGFGNSTIVKWDKSVPNADKLNAVAQFFGVSMEYLLTGADHSCPQCGFCFVLNDDEEISDHKEEHALWEKATLKFGTLYCNSAENEKLKAKGRKNSNDLSLPLEERYNAQLLTLRCLFSRSVQANGFNLDHVPFDKYVAMMLNTEKYRSRLDSKLCQKLMDNFGTLPGIKNGESIYYVPVSSPSTIAAHFDGDEYTEDELEEIRNFAAFVKSKRK